MPTIDTLWMTLFVLFVSLFFWYFFLNTGEHSELSTNNYLKGTKALLKKDYKKAYNFFININRASSSYIESRFFLAQIERIAGNYSNSMSYIDDALEILDKSSSHYIEFIIAKAGIYQAMGIFNEAMKNYKVALQINSSHEEALVELIRLYEITASWHAAIELSRYAEIERGGKLVSITNYYCSLAEELMIKGGKLSLAEDYYKKSLRINNTKRSRITKLMLVRELGEYDQVVPLLVTTLNAYPELIAFIVKEFYTERLDIIHDQLIEVLVTFMRYSSENYDLIIKTLIIQKTDIGCKFSKSMHQILMTDPIIIELENSLDRLLSLKDNIKTDSIYQCNSCNVIVQRFYWQCLTCFAWESVIFNPNVTIKFTPRKIRR
jgi:lipopolysaccharide biosynthesis regulator YciM